MADGNGQSGTDASNANYWAHAGHWAEPAPDGFSYRDFTGSLAALSHGDGGETVLFVAAPWGLVCRSTDGGVRWQQINSGNPSQNTVALLAVPEIHAILAAKSTVEGYDWEGVEGVFLSQDDGETWSDLYNMVRGIEEEARVFSNGQILAVTPRRGLSIGAIDRDYNGRYTLSELATGRGWRYVSVDAPMNWDDWDLEEWRNKYADNYQRMNSQLQISKYSRITALAIADRYRFSANSFEPGGLRGHWYNSDDKDNDDPVIVPIAQDLGQITAMAVTPDATQLYAATADSMIWKSTDMGANWSLYDDAVVDLARSDQQIRLITLSSDGTLHWIGLIGETDADFYTSAPGDLRDVLRRESQALRRAEEQITQIKKQATADVKGLNGLIKQAKDCLAELQAKYDADMKTANDAYADLQETSDAKLGEAAKRYDDLSRKYDADARRLMDEVRGLTGELAAAKTEAKSNIAALKRQAIIDQAAAVRDNQLLAVEHQKNALRIADFIASHAADSAADDHRAEMKKAHDAAIKHQQEALRISAKIAADDKAVSDARHHTELRDQHQAALKHQKDALRIAAKIAADNQRIVTKEHHAELKKAHALALKHQKEALQIAAKIADDEMSAAEREHLTELKQRDAKLAAVKTDLNDKITELNGTIVGLKDTVSDQSDTILAQKTDIKTKDGAIAQLNTDLSTAISDAQDAAKKAAAALDIETKAKKLAEKEQKYVRDPDLQALLPQVSPEHLFDFSGLTHHFTASNTDGQHVIQSPELPGNPPAGLTVEAWVNSTKTTDEQVLLTINQGDLRIDIGVTNAANGQLFVKIQKPDLSYTSIAKFLPVQETTPWVFCLRPDKGALIPEFYSKSGGVIAEFKGTLAGQVFGGANRMNKPLPVPLKDSPISVEIAYPAKGLPPLASLRIHSRALSPDAIQRNMTHGQLDV